MVMWNKKKEIMHQKQNTDEIIMTFTDTDLAGVLSKVGLVICDGIFTLEIYIFPWD